MYKINEIFLSIQGEGPAVGTPVVFVRFAGCNLACPFCDTTHTAEMEMDAGDIEDAILRVLDGVNITEGFTVVLTGGEPLLQVDEYLVQLLKAIGFRLHLETNGSIEAAEECPAGDLARLLDRFAEVVVSPKDEDIDLVVLAHATALKVLTPLPGKLTPKSLSAMGALVSSERSERWREPALILQPETADALGSGERFRAHAHEAGRLALEMHNANRGAWRVIPQTHVWMAVR